MNQFEDTETTSTTASPGRRSTVGGRSFGGMATGLIAAAALMGVTAEDLQPPKRSESLNDKIDSGAFGYDPRRAGERGAKIARRGGLTGKEYRKATKRTRKAVFVAAGKKLRGSTSAISIRQVAGDK